jgi:hypothetical protein
MRKKSPPKAQLSAVELELIERLREHPELMERFQSLLEITASAEGSVKKADEVEKLLIQEMRRLGNVSMESWAAGAEKAAGDELKRTDPLAGVRKKKH